MKNAIITSLKIGAVAGFLSAVIYALFVLVMAEILLPLPAPSEFVIFSIESSGSLMQMLLSTSPIWLILPVFLGAMTSAIFSFVLMKYIPTRKVFNFTSILVSIFLSSPALLYGFIGLISLLLCLFSRCDLHIVFYHTSVVALFFAPSTIYILVSFFTSRYLYNHLLQFGNVTPPSI